MQCLDLLRHSKIIGDQMNQNTLTTSEKHPFAPRSYLFLPTMITVGKQLQLLVHRCSIE